VPVAEGLLWVRPFYASVSQGTGGGNDRVTEYRFIIVSTNERAAFGRTLEEALVKLFPGYEGDLGDRVGGDTATPETPDETPDPTASTPEEALFRADELLREAEEVLATGGLAEYEAKVDEAAALIEQALAGLEPSIDGG